MDGGLPIVSRVLYEIQYEQSADTSRALNSRTQETTALVYASLDTGEPMILVGPDGEIIRRAGASP
jgi:hypothetical protein